MKELGYEGRKDPRVGDLLNKVNSKMSNKHKEIVTEEFNSSNYDDYESLMEELKFLRRAIRDLKEDIQSIVQEELDNLKKEVSIITEGEANDITIILAGNTFKGKIQHTR